MSFKRAIVIAAAAMIIPGMAMAQTNAMFPVTVDFDDNNPGAVEATLSCNTGQPLSQSQDISEGSGVNFVVVDFEDGAMDCEVSITSAPGYTASTGCEFAAVADQSSNPCDFDLSVDFVTVEVMKTWIDENPQYNNSTFASADYSCSNVFNGAGYSTQNGNLNFVGLDAIAFINLRPHWDGSTRCSVFEGPISGAESDASDCEDVTVLIGEDASCTIYNTRLYEGIPTLSQYGLGIMALVMLGVGFVAFRRFV
jgi:hypothetical protein